MADRPGQQWIRNPEAPNQFPTLADLPVRDLCFGPRIRPVRYGVADTQRALRSSTRHVLELPAQRRSLLLPSRRYTPSRPGCCLSRCLFLRHKPASGSPRCDSPCGFNGTLQRPQTVGEPFHKAECTSVTCAWYRVYTARCVSIGVSVCTVQLKCYSMSNQ